MKQSSFNVNKAEDSLGLLLWQTTMTWQRQIKNALEPYDISHAQFVILAILLWLTEQETVPIQSDIINMSKLDKMTVSKALKKLTIERYIKRQEHGIDTRAKIVILTPKGNLLAKRLVPLIEQIDDAFFGKINIADRKLLSTLMTVLNK